MAEQYIRFTEGISVINGKVYNAKHFIVEMKPQQQLLEEGSGDTGFENVKVLPPVQFGEIIFKNIDGATSGMEVHDELTLEFCTEADLDGMIDALKRFKQMRKGR